MYFFYKNSLSRDTGVVFNLRPRVLRVSGVRWLDIWERMDAGGMLFFTRFFFRLIIFRLDKACVALAFSNSTDAKKKKTRDPVSRGPTPNEGKGYGFRRYGTWEGMAERRRMIRRRLRCTRIRYYYYYVTVGSPRSVGFWVVVVGSRPFQYDSERRGSQYSSIAPFGTYGTRTAQSWKSLS